MSRHPSSNPSVAWVRCPVPRRCHELALEASRELGIPVTQVYTCILTRDLWSRNQKRWLEKFVRDVGGSPLPSTDPSSPSLEGEEKGGIPDGEDHGR